MAPAAFYALVHDYFKARGWGIYLSHDAARFTLGASSRIPCRVQVCCFPGMEARASDIDRWIAEADELWGADHWMKPIRGMVAVAQGFFDEVDADRLRAVGMTVLDARTLAEG